MPSSSRIKAQRGGALPGRIAPEDLLRRRSTTGDPRRGVAAAYDQSRRPSHSFVNGRGEEAVDDSFDKKLHDRHPRHLVDRIEQLPSTISAAGARQPQPRGLPRNDEHDLLMDRGDTLPRRYDVPRKQSTSGHDDDMEGRRGLLLSRDGKAVASSSRAMAHDRFDDDDVWTRRRGAAGSRREHHDDDDGDDDGHVGEQRRQRGDEERQGDRQEDRFFGSRHPSSRSVDAKRAEARRPSSSSGGKQSLWEIPSPHPSHPPPASGSARHGDGRVAPSTKSHGTGTHHHPVPRSVDTSRDSKGWDVPHSAGAPPLDFSSTRSAANHTLLPSDTRDTLRATMDHVQACLRSVIHHVGPSVGGGSSLNERGLRDERHVRDVRGGLDQARRSGEATLSTLFRPADRFDAAESNEPLPTTAHVGRRTPAASTSRPMPTTERPGRWVEMAAAASAVLEPPHPSATTTLHRTKLPPQHEATLSSVNSSYGAAAGDEAVGRRPTSDGGHPHGPLHQRLGSPTRRLPPPQPASAASHAAVPPPPSSRPLGASDEGPSASGDSFTPTLQQLNAELALAHRKISELQGQLNDRDSLIDKLRTDNSEAQADSAKSRHELYEATSAHLKRCSQMSAESLRLASERDVALAEMQEVVEKKRYVEDTLRRVDSDLQATRAKYMDCPTNQQLREANDAAAAATAARQAAEAESQRAHTMLAQVKADNDSAAALSQAKSASIERLEAKSGALQTRLGAADDRVRSLESQLALANAALAEAMKRNADVTAAEARAATEAGEHHRAQRSRITELEEALAEQHRAIDVSTAAHRELQTLVDSLHERISLREEQRARDNASIEALREDVASARRAAEDATSVHAEQSKAGDSRMHSLESRVGKLLAEKHLLEKQSEEADSRLSKLQIDCDRWAQQSREAATQRDALKRKVEVLEEQARAAEEDNDTLRAELSHVRSDRSQLIVEVDRLRHTVKERSAETRVILDQMDRAGDIVRRNDALRGSTSSVTTAAVRPNDNRGTTKRADREAGGAGMPLDHPVRLPPMGPSARQDVTSLHDGLRSQLWQRRDATEFSPGSSPEFSEHSPSQQPPHPTVRAGGSRFRGSMSSSSSDTEDASHGPQPRTGHDRSAAVYARGVEVPNSVAVTAPEHRPSSPSGASGRETPTGTTALTSLARMLLRNHVQGMTVSDSVRAVR